MRASFKPRARLLKLLGDQLIGTPQLAIFELIKNSYDADAEKVEVVVFHPLDVRRASIEVTDFGGEGMSLDTIREVWLEPGADHRQIQRLKGERSKKYQRLPLGEKGVGRFAVHKLGQEIELITKAAQSKEVYLKIDWSALENNKYIEDLEIEILENDSPVFFKDEETGTRIIIKKLNSPLEKKDIQNLYRNAMSIQSPFEFSRFKLDQKTPSFTVDLRVDNHPEWTSDLHDLKTIVEQSLFKFSFFFENGKWSWEYQFNPNEALKKEFGINSRVVSANDENCEFEDRFVQKLYAKDRLGFFDGLGPVIGEIYVFDFDSSLKPYYGDQAATKLFMEENQGIRVYRDGMRVYNYGEPNDDWLQMDGRRVNRLSTGLNRRITVGAVSLDLEKTPTLIEKTNREGFIENNSYLRLRAAIKSALGKLENLRLEDKNRLRGLTKDKPKSSVLGLDDPIAELKELTAKNNLEAEFGPTIARLETRFDEMQTVMLTSGMAGLNMAIAFHELSHGIADAKRNLKAGADLGLILEQFERFELLLDTYAGLLKSEKPRSIDLKTLLQSNIDLAKVRLVLHDVVVSCPVLVGDQKNFIVDIPRNLLVSAINNIIDNAIYWLDQRWGSEPKKKYIYIGVSDQFDKGPAIIIADNGPGWRHIEKEQMLRPFRTTKPGGMGIGLYYAQTVMGMTGGEILLLDSGEVEEIPDAADGAIVALVFKGGGDWKKS